jgi:hypothetical protein
MRRNSAQQFEETMNPSDLPSPRPDLPGTGANTLIEQYLRERLLRPGLAQASRLASPWVWQGYLKPGKTTLLTSQWKSGKTTLLALLLARLEKGGELAGLPVAAGRAAVISEEGADNWDARALKLAMGNHVSYFCRPFKTRPSAAQWQALLDAMLVLRRREGLDLVAIDTLAYFLPSGNENLAGAMMDCLRPLSGLTEQGLCVWLMHHPRKGVSLPGQAARGSGALPGYVDIIVEMEWYRQTADEDRRRRLHGHSRHEETRRHLLMELNREGTEYVAATVTPDAEPGGTGQILMQVLEDGLRQLTQNQILEQWPEDFTRPDRATIHRALQRGVEQGLIRRKGTGRKNDAFQYWVAANEVYFDPGPNATPQQKAAWDRAWRIKAYEALGVDVSGWNPMPIEGSAPETAVPAPPEKPAVEEVGPASAEAASPNIAPGAAPLAEPAAPVDAPSMSEPGPAVAVSEAAERDNSSKAAAALLELSAAPIDGAPVLESGQTPPPPVVSASGRVESAEPAALVGPVAPPAPPPPTPVPDPAAIEAERRRWRRWPYG